MSKDLYDYTVVPTKEEYRKENIIDKIHGIPKLNIPASGFLFHNHDYLINDAIVNYNNEIVVAKTFYANMEKYEELYEKKDKKEYDFWARKYAEQTIKELYSIYDKSMHIFNYLYDLKVFPDINFKENVRKKLKSIDRKFYNKINSVYSRLYGDKLKNVVRDDITHNFSNLFFRYIPTYEEGKETGWFTQEELSYSEYKKIIDNICDLLVENKELIIKKLSEAYPKKGTPEYEKKIEELKKQYKELFGEINQGCD